MPHAGGRPSKATIDNQGIICQAIASGAPRRLAAQAVGMHEATLYRHLANNHEFREQVEKAEGQFVARNVALIQKAAIETWTAAAWLLERRYPDEFGRKLQTEQHVVTETIGESQKETIGKILELKRAS